MLQDLGNKGSYRVMYTLTVSGTYDASVVLGATGIANRYFFFLASIMKHSETPMFQFISNILSAFTMETAKQYSKGRWIDIG
jgi:hypothetical protein